MTTATRRPAAAFLVVLAAIVLLTPGADGVRCGDKLFNAPTTTTGER